MCTSNITKKKFIKLLAEVYCYTFLLRIIFVLTRYEDFSFGSLLEALFPFSTVADNFTGCFLLFYLLIPFLNILIRAMTEKEHLSLMAILLCVYVVLPSFAKANVVFNYITWFGVIYIVAAYIRLYPKPWVNNQRIVGAITVFSLLFSWLSIFVRARFSRVTGKPISDAYFFVSDSNKILALTTAVSAFLFFRNLKMGYSKVINVIAASSFGVLQIHANSDTMRQWLWRDVLDNVGVYYEGNVILHAVLSVMAVYFVCTAIDMLRIKFVEKPLFAQERIRYNEIKP